MTAPPPDPETDPGLGASFRAWFPLAASASGGDDARLRLFVFPYAGGRASAFRGWQAGVPEGVEVLALQPPGREQRIAEPPFRSVAEAVPPIADVIAPLCDRPYAFFGHSLGALVAYETRIELARRGVPAPARFFASGSRAPHRTLLSEPVAHLGGEALLERLRTLGGTPQAVLDCRELMDLFLPMLLADFSMSETYLAAEPEPMSVPLLALGGRDDREVDAARVEAWSDVAGAEFELAWFDGGHFFVHEREPEVLAVVSAVLELALE